eukprot:CAMPEP_0206558984 /NCGR_PEP_ID=MMETSP0325_2-20121206/20110_1 /ASSEMBLY_ACC=CAM_ASM_000347 /TAXON_ID=2866 /ORGANISM="Crypthecodinium cohnii, Strain Seligo" /LENGTH=38 /DNA_ID= /DNA_START= /DNA_END= /DNA_ORIENTATION=
MAEEIKLPDIEIKLSERIADALNVKNEFARECFAEFLG